MNKLPWATPEAIGRLSISQLVALYSKPDRKPPTPPPADADEDQET